MSRILKEELKGQQIGVPAEFDEQQEVLIRFMHQEAGEDPAEAIEYISRLQQEISRFEDEEEEIQLNELVIQGILISNGCKVMRN